MLAGLQHSLPTVNLFCIHNARSSLGLGTCHKQQDLTWNLHTVFNCIYFYLCEILFIESNIEVSLLHDQSSFIKLIYIGKEVSQFRKTGKGVSRWHDGGKCTRKGV